MCTYAVRSIAQRTASHIIQLVDTNDNKKNHETGT